MEPFRPEHKIRYHGRMRDHIPLLLLLVAYLVVGALFAKYTPSWQAPDEPAHYNYIRQLAAGSWPVIHPQDYDEAYRREIVSSKFPPSLSIEPLTYEDWQPPLYYLLLTPVFAAFSGALLPLRLFTILIGAGTVLLTYGVARQIWPEQQWLALLTTAFVAFLPQHIAMLAAVNNDSLAELFIGSLLLLLLQVTREPGTESSSGRRWLIIGVLLGLGFLVKATVYIMVPVIGAVLFWAYWKCWHTFLRNSALTFVPAFLLGLPWWLRNLVIYEGFDPMAIAAHNAAVVGQVRTADWLMMYGLWGTLQRFSRTTFQSFWGQFGWMGVLMDARIYLLLRLFSLIVALGLLWALFRGVSSRTKRATIATGDGRPPPFRYTILGLTFALSLLLYVGYNLTFVQHQGRYLFPALIPISIGVAVGIRSWVVPLIARVPILRPLLAALFVLGLIGLDLVALFYFIIPQLTVS